jgi:hypothetical protein
MLSSVRIWRSADPLSTLYSPYEQGLSVDEDRTIAY